MKITIKVESDFDEKKVDLVLSNEELNNDNYVDIIYKKKSMTVDIDSLLTALESFNELRHKRLIRENYYKDEN